MGLVAEVGPAYGPRSPGSLTQVKQMPGPIPMQERAGRPCRKGYSACQVPVANVRRRAVVQGPGSMPWRSSQSGSYSVWS